MTPLPSPTRHRGRRAPVSLYQQHTPRRGAPPTSHSLGVLSAVAACSALLVACSDSPPAPNDERFDEALFRAPPAELGPHVRWWWPGGSVDDATIEAEVARLADVGFAGIELQTLLFGMSQADVDADPRVRTVGSAEYLEHVGAFLRAADARQLSTTLTLGSGWPSGGVFSADVRPRELLYERMDVTGPMDVDIAVPTPSEPSWVAGSNGFFPVTGAFDPEATLLSVQLAPIVDAAATPPVLGVPVDVTSSVVAGSLQHSVPAGAHAVLFVYEHTVDHVVAGAAFPGAVEDAHVIDHLDPRGAERLLAEQSAPWLDALAPLAPDEVFVDSFEFVGELPWSAPFAARFASDTGYALTAELPFLFREGGESKYVDILRGAGPPAFASQSGRGERAREDYEDVRARLFTEGFIEPVAEFASERGVALRMQAHGGYAHVLDAYALADVPESEGLFAVGIMDFLELAGSAAHVAGHRVVSSESFVVINPSPSPLSQDELWMLAGRAYIAGINRLVFHGAAYPYTRSNGARWYPFAPDPASGVISAGPIPITSDVRVGEPDWAFLPEFNRALTRLSYAMTRGVDRSQVAWLLAEREVPDAASIRVGRLRAEQDESDTSLALRRAGYPYDRISPSMLAGARAEGGQLVVGAASYRALILTDWHVAHPDELAAVVQLLAAGVPVVVLGELPARARGLVDAAARDAQIAADAAAVRAAAQVVDEDDELAAALAAEGVLPLLSVRSGDCTTVSTAHRELAEGHLFLLFNEHPASCRATLDIRVPGRRASLLDPVDGRRVRLPRADEATVDLAASRALLLWVEP
jgi:hypothetical protein